MTMVADTNQQAGAGAADETTSSLNSQFKESLRLSEAHEELETDEGDNTHFNTAAEDALQEEESTEHQQQQALRRDAESLVSPREELLSSRSSSLDDYDNNDGEAYRESRSFETLSDGDVFVDAEESFVFQHATSKLLTPYGKGTLIEHRVDDEMNVIQLSYGVLYISNSALAGYHAATTQENVMQLNTALEALELMRRLNLELQCQELGILADHDKCTTCLLNAGRQMKENAEKTLIQQQAEREGKPVPWQRLPRVPKPRKTTKSCFICGHPVCKQHSCAKFRKESQSTVCEDCRKLVNTDFALEQLFMQSSTTSSAMLSRLMDVYDRTRIMLKYSETILPTLIEDLEKSRATKNKVGVGSSGVGMLSGAFGIAATATLLTPAHVVVAPLMICSILFGGTSSAMQTTVETKQHYSSVHQLAARVITFHSVSQAILRACQILSVVATSTAVQPAMISAGESKPDNGKPGRQVRFASSTKPSSGNLAARKNASFFTRSGANAVSTSTTAVSSAATTTTTASASAAAATTSTTAGAAATGAATSAATGAATTGAAGAATTSAATTGAATAATTSTATVTLTAAQLATFAGGALSAAVLVAEAHSMSKTIREMRDGNKCPKAQLLRVILQEIPFLPDTAVLEQECKTYLLVVSEQHITYDQAMQAVREFWDATVTEREEEETAIVESKP